MTLRLNACEEHEKWQVKEHNWCFSNVFVQKQALFLPLLFNPGPTWLWMWLGWRWSSKVEYLIKNGKMVIKIDYCWPLFSWGKRSCSVSIHWGWLSMGDFCVWSVSVLALTSWSTLVRENIPIGSVTDDTPLFFKFFFLLILLIHSTYNASKSLFRKALWKWKRFIYNFQCKVWT